MNTAISCYDLNRGYGVAVYNFAWRRLLSAFYLFMYLFIGNQKEYIL